MITGSFFSSLLVGHLLGDYVFQNKWMAMNKSGSTWKCFVHCAIYTMCVCLCTTFDAAWVGIIFASHFFVDRFSLGDLWLRLINGRTLKEFISNGEDNVPYVNTDWEKRNHYIILRGGFTSIVYTVVDNTFHLVLMLVGCKLFY